MYAVFKKRRPHLVSALNSEKLHKNDGGMK